MQQKGIWKITMKRLEAIITDRSSLGTDFIVHVQNKRELDDLAYVLEKTNFEIEFSLQEQTLRDRKSVV